MSRFQTIFEHTNFIPQPSEEAGAALRELAPAARKIQLPAAFVELWSVEGIVDFFRGHTNSDWPISALEMAAGTKARWHDYDPIAQGFLPFMVENQGVATWAIQLDQGDNPPVFVEVDSGTPPSWQLHAGSFTEWTRCVISDYEVVSSMWWGAQAAVAEAADVAALESCFARGYTTHAWPGRDNLRFRSPMGRLLLWCGEGQTDWMVSPAPGQEAAMLASIIRLSDLESSLYGMNAAARALLSNGQV